MKVKELIEKLKIFPGKAEVNIEFTYNDSDEGKCFGDITDFKFTLTKNGNGLFLTIEEED